MSDLEKQASWAGLADNNVFFDFFDVRKDGFISRLEWTMAFDKLDADKGGSVSRQEWIARGGAPRSFDRILEGFQFKEHKQSISRKEWLEAFDNLDANEDERLSRNEFQESGDSSPGRRFRAKTGVTPEEISQMHHATEASVFFNDAGRQSEALSSGSHPLTQRSVAFAAMTSQSEIGMEDTMFDARLRDETLSLISQEVSQLRDERSALVEGIRSEWKAVLSDMRTERAELLSAKSSADLQSSDGLPKQASAPELKSWLAEVCTELSQEMLSIARTRHSTDRSTAEAPQDAAALRSWLGEVRTQISHDLSDLRAERSQLSVGIHAQWAELLSGLRAEREEAVKAFQSEQAGMLQETLSRMRSERATQFSGMRAEWTEMGNDMRAEGTRLLTGLQSKQDNLLVKLTSLLESNQTELMVLLARVRVASETCDAQAADAQGAHDPWTAKFQSQGEDVSAKSEAEDMGGAAQTVGSPAIESFATVRLRGAHGASGGRVQHNVKFKALVALPDLDSEAEEAALSASKGTAHARRAKYESETGGGRV